MAPSRGQAHIYGTIWLVDRALALRSQRSGVRFPLLACVEILSKVLIPYYLCLPSSDEYLVEWESEVAMMCCSCGIVHKCWILPRGDETLKEWTHGDNCKHRQDYKQVHLHLHLIYFICLRYLKELQCKDFSPLIRTNCSHSHHMLYERSHLAEHSTICVTLWPQKLVDQPFNHWFLCKSAKGNSVFITVFFSTTESDNQ